MAIVWQQLARIVTEMPNRYLARLRLARGRCNGAARFDYVATLDYYSRETVSPPPLSMILSSPNALKMRTG
jgi:hypothetical protein